MLRCNHRHSSYIHHHQAYLCDSTDQCWLEDVGNFGTESLPDFRCIFHAPPNQEPIDRQDWGMTTRHEVQVKCLNHLLNIWIRSNIKNDVHNPFVLPGSNFYGDIDLSNREFHGYIDLQGSIFLGDLDFSKTRFVGIDLSKSIFEKNVSFSGATSTDSWVRFDAAKFKGRAYFGGAIFLEGYFSDAIFEKPVRFKEATFGINAKFNRTHFAEEAYFDGAKFECGCNTEFIGANFDKPVSFKSSNFFGCVSFESKTSVSETVFRDNVDFDFAKFYEYTNFEATIFEKDASFKEATFCKIVNFTDTKFSIVLFDNTNFKQTVKFWLSKFHGDCSFFGVAFDSYVQFHNTCFEKNLDLRNCHFEYSTRFLDCNIHDLRYTTHTGDILSFSEFCNRGNRPTHQNGTWNFSSTDCSRLAFYNVDMSRIEFIFSNVRETKFECCLWEKVNGYSLLHGHSISIQNSPEREGVQNLYQQLKKNYEDNRNYAAAGDFHFREMEVRLMLLHDNKFSIEKMILAMYKQVSDFGENYLKLFYSIFISIFIIAILVGVSQEICPILKKIHFEIFNHSPVTLQFMFDHSFWLFYLDELSSLFLKIPEYFIKVLLIVIPSPIQRSAINDLNLNSISQFFIMIESVFLIILATLFVMSIRRRFRH